MRIFDYIRNNIKSDDAINVIMLTVSVFILGLAIGHQLGYKQGKQRIQAEAIIIGYGETNHLGEFKWME